MQNTVNRIEENLTKNIDLENLAERSGYSMFHFMRLFTAFTGYTLKEYIRKRRLSCAVKTLSKTKLSYKQIAEMYMFKSHEGFIRAFKKNFGITPAKVKSYKSKLMLTSKIELKTFAELDGGKMQAKIVSLPKMYVVGMQCTTSVNNDKIEQLWKDFCPVMDTINNRKGSHYLGMGSSTEPGWKDNWSNDYEFNYMACVEVDENTIPPKNMVLKEISACRYAVFTHKGDVRNLGNTIEYIYGEWLRNCNHELIEHEDFVWYDERFKDNDPNSEVDVYIPIK